MNEHVALQPSTEAYDVDVYAWTRGQVELLRASRFDLIDIDNIIEEIESLGSEQAHSVESHLIVAIEHLAKLLVSSDRNPRRVWRQSVINARNGIKRRLKKSPSLRRELPAMFIDAWPDARDQARSGLRQEEEYLVKDTPPFGLTEVLDPDFLPGD